MSTYARPYGALCILLMVLFDPDDDGMIRFDCNIHSLQIFPAVSVWSFRYGFPTPVSLPLRCLVQYQSVSLFSVLIFCRQWC